MMAPRKAGILTPDALISPGTPLAAAKALRSMKARNDRVVAQFRKELASRRRIERETARITAPIVKLIRQDKRAMEALERRKRLLVPRGRPKVTFPKVLQNVERQIRPGSIFTVVGPPYTYEWGDNSDNDLTQTTWGSYVAYKRAPDAKFNAHVNIGNGGSAWASAGLGRYFVPVGSTTWVRIGLYAPTEFSWEAASDPAPSHTRGFIAIYVVSWNSAGGDERVEVDRVITPWLWSHGTSWFQEHADSGTTTYPSDTTFLATNSRRYAIWAWCHTSADAASSGYARGFISVSLPFMVFEQS